MNAELPSARNQCVLIVDDEPALLEGMEMAFAQAGLEVFSCRTFETAREKLLAAHFDVLVTDVRLGPFNGLQLAVIAHLKQPDMKIIVFSGFDDPVLRSEAVRLGAIYVVKPVSSEHLLRLMAAP